MDVPLSDGRDTEPSTRTFIHRKVYKVLDLRDILPETAEEIARKYTDRIEMYSPSDRKRGWVIFQEISHSHDRQP